MGKRGGQCPEINAREYRILLPLDSADHQLIYTFEPSMMTDDEIVYILVGGEFVRHCTRKRVYELEEKGLIKDKKITNLGRRALAKYMEGQSEYALEAAE
jgi:hypothetical protein